VGFVLELLVGIAWWIILFPLVWVVATPFILIGAIFNRLPYPRAVSSLYSKVTKIWSDWGLAIVP
jgi:hypothetical protein